MLERLVADVPLGAFLSGGVDSNLVVALMAKHGARPPTTIAMGFVEPELSELPQARLVARHLGTENHEYVLQPDEARVLPALVYFHGEPLADPAALATYYLASVARQHVTVVLTGDGGDEGFSGYTSSQAAVVASLLRQAPVKLRAHVADALLALEAQGRGGVQPLRWVAELARSGYVFDPVGARTFRGQPAELWGPELAPHVPAARADALYRRLWREAGDLSWLDRTLDVDLLAQLPNTFLVKTDGAAMAYSVEARYVPGEVLYRSKQGFSLPLRRWMREDLGGLLERFLLSAAAATPSRPGCVS